MSISFDSADAKIARTANVPGHSAFTIAGWWYFDSFPGSGDRGVYMLTNNAVEVCLLRYRQSVGGFRFGHADAGTTFGSSPSTGSRNYIFLRTNGTNTEAGWKSTVHSDFSGRTWSQTGLTTTTPNTLNVGANAFDTTSVDGNVFRLSVWDAFVSDSNLLLAAATDLGYTTSLNTHIPGTATGDPARYADTSGNSRNWTPTGTISDGSDPSLGSSTKPAFYYAQL
jgi:hypothetical protein